MTATTAGAVTALERLRACVRAALDVEAGIATAAPTPMDHELLEVAQRHRVVPLLARHAEALGWDASTRTRLHEATAGDRLALLGLLRQIGGVHGMLDAAGIRHLVIKGAALSALETGDPAARGSGDIDLFVSPDDATWVISLLLDAGARPRRGYPRPTDPWGWRFLLRNYYETTLEHPLATMDVHWWLHPVRPLLPDFATAWARHVEVAIGGTQVPTLAPFDARDLALAGAAKDGWETLRPLADVRRLTRMAPLASPPPPALAATLAVTRAAIGLPAQSSAVESAIARVPARLVERALVAQVAPELRAGGAPGSTLVESLRRLGHGARTPRDAARIARFTVVPGFVLGELDGRAAPRSAAGALGRRMAYVAGRLRGREALGKD